MNSSEENHFHQLLQRSFEGRLTDSETRELREWLKKDPDAVERYLEHCRMESWLRDPALHSEPEAGKVVALAEVEKTGETTANDRPFWSGRRLAAVGVAAVVLLCGIVWQSGLYPVRSGTIQGTVSENTRDWKTLVATTGSQSHPPLAGNGVPDSRSQKPVRFNRDIRPIFSETCFHCHGPDEEGRRADLRLDVATATQKDAEGFQPIVPGDAEASEVWWRIISEDEDELMPPPKSHLAITAGQKKLIKRWIEEGAEYEGHWSFAAPSRPDVPEIAVKDGNEIDAFIYRRLAEEGLQPEPRADRRTLARRLYLDLTGLPPGRDEIRAFLNDTEPGAYERLVDQLLASPHFGERMAVSWMDQARYADTNGYSIDGGRHMWLWRDWVIQAYNSNLPFDQFTIEQFAGDLLPNATEPQLIATGFNRNHMITHEGGTIPAENLMNYCADRVKTTSEVFLGLTMACAQCHDHKYDPVSQRDYYRFYAYFNSIGDKGLDGNAGKNSAPFIEAKSPIPHNTEPVRKLLDKAREELNRPREEALQIWVESVRGELDQLGANQKKYPVHIVGAKTPNRNTSWVTVEDGELVHLNTARRSAFTFSAQVPDCDGAEITALRVVFEPDPETKTLGWAAKEYEGAFFVSSVLISGGELPSDEINLYRLQPFHDVTASSWNLEYPPENVIDERGEFAWTTFPEVNSPQRLTIHFSEPIRAAYLPYLTVMINFSCDDTRVTPNARRLRFEVITGKDDDTNYPERLQKIVRSDSAKFTESDQVYLRDQFRKLAPEVSGLRIRIANLERRLSEMTEAHSVMVMNTATKPRETFILHRGDYASPTEKVLTGTPSVLPLEAGGTRLDLAKWLVDPAHPLTSRVTVNRFWQMLFGTGLVATTADFGSQGEWPSHPELLDWLAVEFRESGWDMKAVIKKIVMSASYRQDSRITPEKLERDPANRLLARGPRFRLQAEFIRDAALKTSGQLVPWIGGASVNPGQPENLWKEVSHFGSSPATAQAHVADRGLERRRRSLYTFWKRTVPPPNMATFDAPNREFCVMQRSSTNTPLQALVLLNDPHFVSATKAFAKRISDACPDDAGKAIDVAFEEATGRLPDEFERKELLSMYKEDGDFFQVAQLIMNLSETITKE